MDNLMDAMGWQLSNGCFGDNFFAASELDNGDKVPEGNLSTIQTFSKDKRSLPLTTRWGRGGINFGKYRPDEKPRPALETLVLLFPRGDEIQILPG